MPSRIDARALTGAKSNRAVIDLTLRLLITSKQKGAMIDGICGRCQNCRRTSVRREQIILGFPLEEPILEAVGLSMWEYVIVGELATGTAISQVELSRRTGRDPTRLGKHLDALADRGVIGREKSADGRQHTVRLTDAGQAMHDRAKRTIRAAEDEFLRATLPDEDAIRLRRLIAALAGD
ncbi:MarR family winged helix-turn-helix transcriptional regulator [Tsukamurella soli]|uniref:HTH marR-type domain-containing protein n=1 Tax=Tsukamurella soli TaxID=644556 RepID=A0ABP8J3G5_9ACTN